jgi:hypothetical protein
MTRTLQKCPIICPAFKPTDELAPQTTTRTRLDFPYAPFLRLPRGAGDVLETLAVPLAGERQRGGDFPVPND